MRQLNSHLSPGFNNLMVAAVDNPSPGFANARYDIAGFNTIYNAQAANGGGSAHFTRLPIIFHTGPQAIDMPLNGVTPEVLLAVIADHLRGKQASPDACMENQMAKDYVEAALHMLSQRHAHPMGFAGYSTQDLQTNAAMSL